MSEPQSALGMMSSQADMPQASNARRSRARIPANEIQREIDETAEEVRKDFEVFLSR
jgi:hypothetical protein